MIIEIREQGNGSVAFDFTFVPDLGEDAARVAAPVRLAGNLESAEGRIAVSGRISGSVECDCVRCLKPVSVPLERTFRDVFVTLDRYRADASGELAEDDLDVAIFDGEAIDLAEVGREQILLFLPEQVFCADDCRGLCAACGADLNQGDCGCAANDIDPRWAGLKDLGS